MARIRSSPRAASRHSGRLYDRGHQFSIPNRDSVPLGPWRGVWPLGERQVPADILQSLVDGVLVDGVVYPIWSRNTSTLANRTTVGAFEFGLTNGNFHIQFFRDRANMDELKIFRDNGSTNATISTALTSASERVVAAPWQNYVYFAHEALGTIHRYSILDDTVTSIAGSPANVEFLFVLHNNLCAVYKSGNAYIVAWAADQLPEDWAGTGSGSFVLQGAIGPVRGVALHDDHAMIIGAIGGKRMIPTGIATPSFRFEDVAAIKGCPFKHSVAGGEGRTFYVNYERRVVVFDGESVRDIGQGEESFDVAPMLVFSRRLERLVVSASDPEITLLLDTGSGQWVSNLPLSFDFLSDSPGTTEVGKVLGYNNAATDYDLTTLDLAPAAFKQPILQTGRLIFGIAANVDSIDLHRTSPSNPVPAVRAFLQLRQGQIASKELADAVIDPIEELGTIVRYWINHYAEAIEIHIDVNTSDGPFDLNNINNAGNVPILIGNPPGALRADPNVAGNAAISVGASTYTASHINEAGNLVLEVIDPSRSDSWSKTTGLERMVVRLSTEDDNVLTAT